MWKQFLSNRCLIKHYTLNVFVYNLASWLAMLTRIAIRFLGITRLYGKRIIVFSLLLE